MPTIKRKCPCSSNVCRSLEFMGATFWFGLLGFNASATARVISRRWNDDDEISFLVEETGVPGGNHRPTASHVLCPQTGMLDVLQPENARNIRHTDRITYKSLTNGCSHGLMRTRTLTRTTHHVQMDDLQLLSGKVTLCRSPNLTNQNLQISGACYGVPGLWFSADQGAYHKSAFLCCYSNQAC